MADLIPATSRAPERLSGRAQAAALLYANGETKRSIEQRLRLSPPTLLRLERSPLWQALVEQERQKLRERVHDQLYKIMADAAPHLLTQLVAMCDDETVETKERARIVNTVLDRFDKHSGITDGSGKRLWEPPPEEALRLRAIVEEARAPIPEMPHAQSAPDPRAQAVSLDMAYEQAREREREARGVEVVPTS
jgi:hypothetical protein